MQKSNEMCALFGANVTRLQYQHLQRVPSKCSPKMRTFDSKNVRFAKGSCQTLCWKLQKADKHGISGQYEQTRWKRCYWSSWNWRMGEGACVSCSFHFYIQFMLETPKTLHFIDLKFSQERQHGMGKAIRMFKIFHPALLCTKSPKLCNFSVGNLWFATCRKSRKGHFRTVAIRNRDSGRNQWPAVHSQGRS